MIETQQNLDRETFTFHPKMNSRTNKLVENMKSDFMARQNLHLQKQMNMLKQASTHFRSPYLTDSSTVSNLKHLKDKAKERKTELKYLPHPHHKIDQLKDSPYSKSAINTAVVPPTKTSVETETDGSSTQTHNNNYTTTVTAQNSKDYKQKPNERSYLHRQRSKTLPIDKPREETASPSPEVPPLRKSSSIVEFGSDRLKQAKSLAEHAIRRKKIFTIQGPYHQLRKSLRIRGWVEKFYHLDKEKKSPRSQKANKNKQNSDDDDDADDYIDDVDDNDDECDGDGMRTASPTSGKERKINPWEEDGGIYGIMSRLVKNYPPSFVFTLKRDNIDYKYLCKDQIANHFCKAGSFTTKSGLCTNLRNVHWYAPTISEAFYPRAYRLCNEEEKAEFIDDFRLTSCMNILKIIFMRHSINPGEEETQTGPYLSDSEQLPELNKRRSSDLESKGNTRSSSSYQCDHAAKNPNDQNKDEISNTGTSSPVPSTKPTELPYRVIEVALQQCEKVMMMKEHADLDVHEEIFPVSSPQWDEFLGWYYQIVSGAVVRRSKTRLSDIRVMIRRLRRAFPQFDLDGVRNIWMVKPGAKSRGRGIMCYDRLDEMLKLVNSTFTRDGKFVVQKYIERPFLVYNTKFDIRQWFIVTDFAPLTIWWYKDCYLRFCSHQYTLDNYDEQIHLSNNSIQKNYKNEAGRDNRLPGDNMWMHYEFKQFLAKSGRDSVWDDKVLPGMKDAVVNALLTAQDIAEPRKNSFELYGADFMVTEDLNPWLIEINSSPSVSTSTGPTAELVPAVLEDMVKLIIDRRNDKNCDVGGFELIYKQNSIAVPSYVGLNLSLEGRSLQKRFSSLDNDDFPRRSSIFPNFNRANAPPYERHLSKSLDITNNRINRDRSPKVGSKSTRDLHNPIRRIRSDKAKQIKHIGVGHHNPQRFNQRSISVEKPALSRSATPVSIVLSNSGEPDVNNNIIGLTVDVDCPKTKSCSNHSNNSSKLSPSNGVILTEDQKNFVANGLSFPLESRTPASVNVSPSKPAYLGSDSNQSVMPCLTPNNRPNNVCSASLNTTSVPHHSLTKYLQNQTSYTNYRKGLMLAAKNSTGDFHFPTKTPSPYHTVSNRIQHNPVRSIIRPFEDKTNVSDSSSSESLWGTMPALPKVGLKYAHEHSKPISDTDENVIDLPHSVSNTNTGSNNNNNSRPNPVTLQPQISHRDITRDFYSLPKVSIVTTYFA